MISLISELSQVLSIELDLGGFSVSLGGLLLGFLLLRGGLWLFGSVSDVQELETQVHFEEQSDQIDGYLNYAYDMQKSHGLGPYTDEDIPYMDMEVQERFDRLQRSLDDYLKSVS